MIVPPPAAAVRTPSMATVTTCCQGFKAEPTNPQFISYQVNLSLGRVPQKTATGNGLGGAPSPVDLSRFRGRIIPSLNVNGMAIPSWYDLRAYGKVSAVKNQNPAGTCWAFATYGSLESYLRPGGLWDFSENNLKNTAGFDMDPNYGGGQRLMSTAYLARWSGPVLESADPYNPYTEWSPSGLVTQKHVQNVYYLPDRAGPLDNFNIKAALVTYGGIDTAMYMDDVTAHGYYRPATASYYYNGGAAPNHDVTIIGWDDNFNRNNFAIVPPGNGAFIVKNSWGKNWGNNGFFYVSYYDTLIGTQNAVFTAAPLANFNFEYAYDRLGWTDNVGAGTNTAWFANIFKPVSNQMLYAVGFYVPQPNSQYEVYVSNGATISLVAMGTQACPGYFTFKLTNPSVLTKNVNFIVMVKLTTPGYNFPVCVERPIPGYSSRATALPGQSYISTDGNTWTDMTTVLANTNVCLKAYTAVR